MIDGELNDITEAVLRELIAEQISEGKTLEFKRALDINDPDARLKFLRGVASFANAAGGDLIFGMVANKEGKAEGLVPLDNFNPDRDTLRLRDIVRMNIEPRSIFLEFKPVELSGGGFALVIRIQKSWAGAHFVTHNGDLKFFTRDHGGKRPMDVSEIRNAFNAAEGVADKINRFRSERISNIIAEETPEPLVSGFKVVLHLCPLSAFVPGKRCDLNQLNEGRLRPLDADSFGNSRHDVEGYYVYELIEGKGSNYTLVSHSGWIEAVEADGPLPQTGQLAIFSIEERLLKGLAAYFKILKLIGSEAPVAVMLSFVNVRGAIVYLDPKYQNRTARPITRDNILIPGAIVETLDVEASDRTKINTIDILRPMFDVLWNACGLPKSRNFDAEGNWNDRR